MKTTAIIFSVLLLAVLAGFAYSSNEKGDKPGKTDLMCRQKALHSKNCEAIVEFGSEKYSCSGVFPKCTAAQLQVSPPRATIIFKTPLRNQTLSKPRLYSEGWNLGYYPIEYYVENDKEILSVKVYDNNQLITYDPSGCIFDDVFPEYSTASYSNQCYWDFPGRSLGLHTLRVDVADADGVDSNSIRVMLTGPDVYLQNPYEGALLRKGIDSPVKISVLIDSLEPITLVEFKIDSVPLQGCTQTPNTVGANVSCSWNIDDPGLSSSTHLVSVEATSSEGTGKDDALVWVAD